MLKNIFVSGYFKRDDKVAVLCHFKRNDALKEFTNEYIKTRYYSKNIRNMNDIIMVKDSFVYFESKRSDKDIYKALSDLDGIIGEINIKEKEKEA